MKKILLLLLFLISSELYAQQYFAAAKIDGPWGGSWGYIDTTGNWVVEPKFQEAFPFSEGFARVKYSGNWGYIDKKGNWMLPPYCPNLGDFSNGLAKARKQGEKWYGIIDTTGATYLNFEYEFAELFSSGYSKSKKNNKRWKFVDKNGAVLKTVDFKECESFKEGLARVRVKGKWGFIDSKWGFIDSTGALAIPAIFNVAGDFNDGLASARFRGKFGYIDHKGNFAIETKYKVAKDFSDKLARVYSQGCWSFIDTSGKTVIAFDRTVDLVSIFTNGFARVDCGDIGYVNRKGEVVVETKWVIAKDFNFGIAAVRDGGDFVLIDSTGKVLTKGFANLDVCNNGYVRAKVLTMKDQCGFIDRNGNWLIEPKFIELGMFVNVDESYKKGFVKESAGYPIPYSMPKGVNPNDFR